MGTPGVDSPHTLFLFSTPLTARETASTVHWPIKACGCSCIPPHRFSLIFLLIYVQLFYATWRQYCIFSDSHKNAKSAWLRLPLSDPDNINMTDTVLLLNSLALITGRLLIKEDYCNWGLPLVLFTVSWTVTRVIVLVKLSSRRVYLYQIVVVLTFYWYPT